MLVGTQSIAVVGPGIWAANSSVRARNASAPPFFTAIEVMTGMPSAADMAPAFDAAIESLHARHALKTDSVMGSLGGPEVTAGFVRRDPTPTP